MLFHSNPVYILHPFYAVFAIFMESSLLSRKAKNLVNATSQLIHEPSLPSPASRSKPYPPL
jgi:hypothetical protein